MELPKDVEEKLFKLAVKNAYQHGGKCLPKPILGMFLKDNPKYRKNARNLLSFLENLVEKINEMSEEELEKKAKDIGILEELREEKSKKISGFFPELPPLPKAENGKVVMRIAPFPSGPIHIGNARPFIINDEYVKKYKGKLILVMDDTIGGGGKEIVPEAYDLIKEDLNYLGIKYEEVVFKSDRLEIYYKYAKELIKKGYAYVCFCSQEKISDLRKKGEECEHRNYSVKENLEYFEKMIKGEFKQGEAVLRIKTDMKHKNPAFRDRVIMRISEKKHPRVGKKYKVWPLLEFSWAIDDYLLGITHIIRGKDLMMETMMENYIWNIFGWKSPVIIHTGLLRIEGIKLSKSKAQKEVKEGKYFGWDDPRTWSIQSLKRRGILPEAIRKFVLSFGLTKHDITVPIEALYKENRRIIDPIANRYFFVYDFVELEIKGINEKKKVEIPFHPEDNNRGKRKLIVEPKNKIFVCRSDLMEVVKREEKIFRLKDFINLKLVDFDENKNKAVGKIFEGQIDIKKILKIQWVPKNQAIQCSVVMPDASILRGLAEDNVLKEEVNSIIQFERFGFCKIDEKINKELKTYYTHG